MPRRRIIRHGFNSGNSIAQMITGYANLKKATVCKLGSAQLLQGL